MSLLFDQNLSRRLPALLSREFPLCEQAYIAGLSEADDRQVWVYAKRRGLAIVSKDSDFVTLSRALGPPPKVIWLRIGNTPTSAVVLLLRTRASEVSKFLSDPSAAVLELSSR